MDDMRLDPASNEPTRQPEAVAARLIGQRDPADRPASTHRLVPPPLDQSQQCCRIWLQFLQRLTLDAGNSAAYQPARLAHLDDHHQGRDRSGRIEARIGLRMMPTFPRSPLSFRTAGFPSVRLKGWPF